LDEGGPLVNVMGGTVANTPKKVKIW